MRFKLYDSITTLLRLCYRTVCKVTGRDQCTKTDKCSFDSLHSLCYPKTYTTRDDRGGVFVSSLKT